MNQPMERQQDGMKESVGSGRRKKNGQCLLW